MGAILKQTFHSLASPRIFKLFLLSLLLTFLGLSLFLAGTIWIFHHTTWFNWSWLEWIIDAVGSIGIVILSWFLFPVLVPLIGSLFVDKTAEIVEKETYQITSTPESMSWWKDLWYGLKFTLLSLFVNIICLPFYLIPVLNIGLYYGVNGYLLGREFFDIVAKRRIPLNALDRARKQQLGLLWGMGIFLVFITNIPLLNLLTPFIAIVMMTHFLQRNIIKASQ